MPQHDLSPAPGSAIQRFIDAHREQGHRCAALDPLALAPTADAAELLAPAAFGLAPDDPSVQGLDRRLKAIYCGALALDASALRDPQRRAWLQARMEEEDDEAQNHGGPLLERLLQAQAWEHHVAEQHPQAKRFSLEGHEALLPLLDALLARAASQGMQEVFMGMPHRGRLNLLVNLLGLPPAQALAHFGADADAAHRDLVYHLGGRSRLRTERGELMLTLAHNPSHLQSVYPVVLGMARAAARRQRRCATLVLHGDAAFAGQGVVMETLMLAQRPGYSVGGTVHVIINNQLGFTEPNPMDGRAARYCTDVARMIDAPVLRLNAEAPALLARAARLALDYRQRFGADVLIDLIGCRRLGHSEHDLPALTSPRLYPQLQRRPTVVELQARDCGVGDADLAARRLAWQRRFSTADAIPGAGRLEANLQMAPPPAAAAPLSQPQLAVLLQAMTRLPAQFEPHPLIAALIGQWRLAIDAAEPRIDWCLAENLAYASLLHAGIDVRLSGMDVGRGTFMHRQAVWHSQNAEHPAVFVPLQQVAPGTARFEAINSPLSEEAVLGYEYGHSVQDRQGLTLWEAQFGDFVNGAQVFVDQYLAAGEEKWGYRSALAVLLPHGYEGIGPEHSSGFISRFLQLCGADNLRVACPSTAAQWFHLLRRQALDPERKPLVVMTPKTQLHKEAGARASLAELLDGGFRPVLDDAEAAPAQVRRLLLCSGKLFYALQRERAALGEDMAQGLALLRLEQLYPFPHQELAALLARYPRLETLVWAQEETRNQGAWAQVRDDLAALCPPQARLVEVSRAVTAAGATASTGLHQRQQRELVRQALGLP
ncbi:2-oxoglutarate dehydrogenase E1 component [Roseateles sp. DAIF2]|uniref:2-oxoglutarate dehydrogenase E1 component n=1 Tax=Roseateles sp. DAIF2 TaxID=2714952 RepID=UPI0018A2F8BD|nr:2-oxoglutarate dehydrogenase E1 component [Roseateles sp. DAIF2]QPF73433.1 2-oxoglutarate dehydrogenase E1 component [Roseateles sp. DAIF2]